MVKGLSHASAPFAIELEECSFSYKNSARASLDLSLIHICSQYWNQVHGSPPAEVLRDEEGMQTMRTLGRNMAWLMKCIEAGKAAGIERPVQDPVIRTNFIR